MTSTAAPRSPRARSAARSLPPARATSSAVTSATTAGSPSTPMSTSSVRGRARGCRSRTKAYSWPLVSSVPSRRIGARRHAPQGCSTAPRPRRRRARGRRTWQGRGSRGTPACRRRRCRCRARRPSGCARCHRGRAGATSRSTHCSARPEIDVDDFFHRRMTMERVALAGGHADADEQQLARVGEPGPAQPLVRSPRQLLDLDVRRRSRSAGRLAPGISCHVHPPSRREPHVYHRARVVLRTHRAEDGRGTGPERSRGSAASDLVDGACRRSRQRTTATSSTGERSDGRCLHARRQPRTAVLRDLPGADPDRRVVCARQQHPRAR